MRYIVLIGLLLNGCTFVETTAGNLFSAANQAANDLDGIPPPPPLKEEPIAVASNSSVVDDFGYFLGQVVGGVVAIGAGVLIAAGQASQQQSLSSYNQNSIYRSPPVCTSVEIVEGYWRHDCR